MAKNTTGVNIQVLLRCRPTNGEEKRRNQQQVVKCDELKKDVTISLTVAGKGNTRSFTFDKVFGPDSSQHTVFDEGVRPIVKEVMEGFSCTVFAYGQTGTGKTHTMQGDLQRSDEGDLPDAAGIIPRAVKQIFDTLEKQYTEYSVKVTYLELYNEEITDLLGSEESLPMSSKQGQKGLPLLEASDGSVHVKGLEEEIVKDTDDIFRVLQRGSNRRRTASTDLNTQSSRSHSIFTIIIHMKETTPDGEDLMKCGKLNLVDLAGSENIGRSGAKDGRAREAGEINKSLLTLSRVISNLVEHQPFVPYRDSKLTRLLRDSLGGKTKTCIVATVAPTVLCQEETVRTLEYAQKAKNIKNNPQANQKLTKTAHLRELTTQIERLRTELFAAREKDGVFLPQEQYERDQRELEVLRAATREQEEALSLKNEESEMQARKAEQKLEDLRAEMQGSIDELNSVIGTKNQELKEERATVVKLEGELEETQAALEWIRTELQNFKEEVSRLNSVVTKKDRIIKSLEAAESSLAKISFQIRADHDGAASDVGGLFSKLDRLHNLEAENQSLRQQFGKTLETKKSGMLNSIVDLQQTVQNADKNTRAYLSSLAGQQKEATTSHQEGLQALRVLLDQGLASIDNHVKSCQSSVNVDIDTMGSINNSFLHEAIKAFTVARDSAALSQGDLQDHIASAEETIHGLQNNWEQMAASMDESASKMGQVIEEGLRKICDDVGIASKKLEENAAKVKECGARMLKELQEEQESDVSVLAQMLERMKEKNSQQVGKLFATMVDAIDTSRQLGSEKETRVKDNSRRTREQADEVMQTAKSMRGSHIDCLHGLNKKAITGLSDMVQMVDGIHTPFTTALGAFSETSSAHGEAMSKSLLKTQADINTLSASVHNSTVEAVESYKQQQQKLGSSICDSSSSLVTALEAASAESKENSECLVSATKQHAADVHQVLDQVISFGPKIYAPTQSTPKKRPLETITEEQISAVRFKNNLQEASTPPTKHQVSNNDSVTPRQALGNVSNILTSYATTPPR